MHDLIAALMLAGASAPAPATVPEAPGAMDTVAAARQTPQADAPPVIVLPVFDSPPQPAAETEPTADPTLPPDSNVIVVEGQRAPPGDPLAQVNAQSYEIVQAVDRVLVEPLADVYRDVLPKPVRSGLRNFFFNLGEPIVFLNFLLQGKPGKAVETLGRFAINSTIGIGGLMDVAKKEPFNLPRRENGFANTLGYHGVKPGAYLVVPLIGPTTVRDLIGNLVDAATLPNLIGRPYNRPYYGPPAFTVRALDDRIVFDEKLESIRQSDDPYATARETYLRNRQAAIDELRGKVAEPAAEESPVDVTSETTTDTPVEAPIEPAAPAEPEMQVQP
jgi:phospholipid-binding lipoprotein MlaA